MTVPLNANGQIKLQVFADGHAPYSVIIDESAPVNNIPLARSWECS
jgi:hypothetical protein